MPLWKCKKCHHEWEGSTTDKQCDWCGVPGGILEKETPLERMINKLIRQGNVLVTSDYLKEK